MNKEDCITYLHSGEGDGVHHFINPRQGNPITGKWALDNDCFNGPFNKNKFDRKLQKLDKANCLFIVMPDKMGDPFETMRLWHIHSKEYLGWPKAFVAQDGQEHCEFPPSTEWEVLFIGGSTEWKMGKGAIKCIQYAQSAGKRVHIGRINSYRRFKHFANLPESGGFTCDGTMQRFMGSERSVALAKKWEDASKLHIHLPFPISDNTC